MIKFEEFNNTKQHLSCNSCGEGYEEPKLYNVIIPTGKYSSMIVRLCKDCAKELRGAIKFRK